MMQDRFAARKKLVETQETYYKKFKKVLNIRQVEALFKDNGPKRAQRPCMKNPQCPQQPKGKWDKLRHLATDVRLHRNKFPLMQDL